MRLKNLDLFVTVIIAVLNVVWALLPSHIPLIGIILAVPLVFVLPGYLLTKILFHKRAVSASHCLLLSLGLSLAIDVLSGLILNMFPPGLETRSWAILLGLLTTGFSLLLAYLRRGVAPLNGAHPRRLGLSIPGYILFALAITVVILSVLYSAIGQAQQPHLGFTQLWLLPSPQAGKSCTARLGVRSFESTPVTYLIVMTMNGAEMSTWTVSLVPEEEWDRLVPITPRVTDNVSVEARLYRVDKLGNVYRKVNVTLYNCPALQLAPYPSLASAYKGMIDDIPANVTTNMSLTGIQESAGNITGYFTISAGLKGDGPFTGMVTATKQIHVTVTDDAGHATFSFEGVIDAGGNLVGSYCGLDQAGQCSSNSDYGLWSVAPVRPSTLPLNASTW